MNHSVTLYDNNNPCYDILLRNSFEGLYEAMSTLSVTRKRICIVSDSRVDSLYGTMVETYLKEHGCPFVVRFVFPEGEEHKTLSVIEELYAFLIRHEFDRSDVLLALGGGVTGDMTGFTAATYLRGIRFVQVPTSLLAMVDSSIGGKTGVDFKGYKNMIGAFYQPSLVFVNTEVLKTLEGRQRASGMGEIIKHGLIRDRAYYDWLEEHADLVVSLNEEAVSEMIYKSELIKKAVVEADPKEKGERALLNFGHTIGHAIEKALDFSLLHGECVSLGIVAASYLSMQRGYITKDELYQTEQLLLSYGLPVRYAFLDREEVLKNCRHDKKKDGTKIKFVLLKQIGEAFITTDVSEAEMGQAIDYVSVT